MTPVFISFENKTRACCLRSYTEGCARDVRNAIIDMKEKGMKGLVLDLRGNGGGSEMEAVNIVNCLVPKGRLVVSNRGKMKKVNHDYYTQVEPVDTIMPVVATSCCLLSCWQPR